MNELQKNKTFNQHLFMDYSEGKINFETLVNDVANSPHKTTLLNTGDRYIDTNYEQTDLRLAIKIGDLKLIDHFISLGYPLSDTDIYGNDVLIYSLSNAHYDKRLLIVNHLTSNYANLIDFSHINFAGQNALFRLLSGVKYLIDDENLILSHKNNKLEQPILNPKTQEELNSVYDILKLGNFYNKDAGYDHNFYYLKIFNVLKEKQIQIKDKNDYSMVLSCSLSNIYFLPTLIQNNFDYSDITRGSWERNFFTFESSGKQSLIDWDFSSFLLCKDGYNFFDRIYLFNQVINLIKENNYKFGYQSDIEKLFKK